MYYSLIIKMVEFVRLYEQECPEQGQDVHPFGQWLTAHFLQNDKPLVGEPDWEGKSQGRSADSFINSSLVHLYRYAKLQAKAVITDTEFSTPDDFIYLITLTSFGSMTKTGLIRFNVHEKSAGMQIINRLISRGLVEQTEHTGDKRNRMIHISPKGTKILNESMDRIRAASRNVTEPLNHLEKMDLIRLLSKLERFHEAKSR